MKPLTKSRFKLGLECPNKLYFTSKSEYVNNKKEDSFLQSLAQGGFQVEELARIGYEGGKLVDAEHHEYEKAVQITEEELAKENAILFEAAFYFDHLFVRTDIVDKKGSHVKLVEVKAKSFDPTASDLFIGKRGGITAAWKPYLFDLAFQKFVAQKAYPRLTFTAYLLMADKTKQAAINGLNQLFRIPKNGDPRKDIVKKVGSLSEIGGTVLSEVNVNEIINGIISDQHRYFDKLSFEETIGMLKNGYISDTYLDWPTNFSSCRNCEFKASTQQIKEGYLSGFNYCMTRHHQWGDADFQQPNAMEVWNYRGGKLVEENRLLMKDLTQEDFKIKTEVDKISSSERQWLQVEKALAKDNSIHVLTGQLQTKMELWKFPLHFIDFETSSVALPFTKGRRPYEQVAFQFSHHVYNEDGKIEHANQYIGSMPGEFPNFSFARALKQALGNDDGNIFRYAAHENTIINAIINQLKESNEPDKEDLITFLKTISTSTQGSADKWEGNRNMIDLKQIIVDYYYNPLTGGSNSIKYVLPACINSSPYLQSKYILPISEISVSSQNFSSNHIWLRNDGEKFLNPYSLLPPLFDGWQIEDLDTLVSDVEGIFDGGAALTAYAKLQYEDMSAEERAELTQGLLNYCELDTLGMVMLYEHFKHDL